MRSFNSGYRLGQLWCFQKGPKGGHFWEEFGNEKVFAHEKSL